MKKRVQSILKQALCISLCLVVVIPFYLVVINSFKGKSEAARMGLGFPKEWNIIENYSYVIREGRLLIGFGNSFLYAFVSTALAVVLCSMAAFVICRNKTKFHNFVYYYILCGLFFPANYVTLVKVMISLKLYDTRIGIILFFTAHVIAFCVFTIRNFIVTVPVEMDEAAIIDGAGSYSLFFKIILPLLKPVAMTCFVLVFLIIWSDFMSPLYLLGSSDKWPMNLAVYNFFGRYNSYWNYVFADIVLTCIPVILVYLFGQKYIMSGLTSGAVKE